MSLKKRYYSLIVLFEVLIFTLCFVWEETSFSAEGDKKLNFKDILYVNRDEITGKLIGLACLNGKDLLLYDYPSNEQGLFWAQNDVAEQHCGKNTSVGYSKQQIIDMRESEFLGCLNDQAVMYQYPCNQIKVLLSDVKEGKCGLHGQPTVQQSSVNTSKQKTIYYGVQPATMPIYIARALGLISAIEAKHQVKIEFRAFPYGAPENQAMASGELQMASAGMAPVVVAASRLPVKILAITILEQTAILVTHQSGINTVAELRGKKVAFPGEGSQQYPLLLKALADNGLTIYDISLVKAKGEEIPDLLKNNAVDAGITWDPHVSRALADGYAKLLIKANEILPIKGEHYIGNGEYAREDFIQANPELVQDLVMANVKAVDYILTHPLNAAKFWQQQIGVPMKILQLSLLEGISAYSHNIVPDPLTIKTYTDFLKEAKILLPEDSPKIDASFAQKAVNFKSDF